MGRNGSEKLEKGGGKEEADRLKAERPIFQREGRGEVHNKACSLDIKSS